MSSLFLSYSSADAVAARHLKDRLEEAGYRAVFRDRDERDGIPAGTPWVNELLSSLERADVVLFLATTHSLASVWCHTELALAVARGKVVIQVALPDVPVHPLLTHVQGLSAPSMEVLVDLLVRSLSRLGHPPGDPFSWDPGVSPYPGLGRLTEQHAEVLFGRDREITSLLDRLAAARPDPILIVGPSGSGKSSLVRAGVLPRLSLQPSIVLPPVVEPGAHGVRRVLAALTSAERAERPTSIGEAVDRLVVDGRRAVLVLDQVEDALMPAGRDEATELFRQLHAVDRDRLAVVVILRSASLESWLRRPELTSFAPGDPVWIRPLQRSGLREVITGPARVAGIRFDPPELVDRILDDTGHGQALPLLAALLEELTRDHSRITPSVISADKYLTVGPVARVVERRASTSTVELSRRYGISERVAVQAYLRLVDVDERGQTTRSELSVDGLSSEEARVFEVLEANRLVIRDQRPAHEGSKPVVPGEPAASEVLVAPHEEVFRSWPAVAGAIESERHDLEVRTWLRRDTRSWATTGRGSVPLTGGRLELALDWQERNRAESANSGIGDYVRAAVRQRSRRRLLTIAAPVLTVVLVVVSVLAARLSVEAGRAQRARDEAESLRLAGASATAMTDRLDLGLLLALEAAVRSDDVQVDAAPLVGLTTGAGPTAFYQLTGPVDRAVVDEAGSRAVLMDSEGLSLWDVVAAEKLTSVTGIADAIAIDAAGSTIATASDGQVDIRSWDSPGSPAVSCRAPPGRVELLRFAASSDLLAIVAVDRSSVPPRSVASVVDSQSCSEVMSHSVQALVVDVDVSGAILALALEDSGLEVARLDTGSSSVLVPPGAAAVRAVTVDENRLAAATEHGGVWLWDAVVPQPPQLVVGAGQAIVAVRFAADGSVVTADVAGSLTVVRPEADPAVGPAVQSLPRLGYSGPVGALDLAVADSGVTTVDPSGRVISWDLTGRWSTGEPVLASGRFDAIASSRGDAVVAAGQGGIWVSTKSHTPARLAAEVAAVTEVAATGTGWVAGTGDGAVVAGDFGADALPTSAARAVMDIGSEVRGVGALADGSIAAVGADGTVMVMTVGGELSTVRIDEEPRVLVVNQQRLIVGTWSGAVLVLDGDDLERAPTRIAAHSADVASVAVDATGDLVASGSDDRAIVLWHEDDDGNLVEQFRLVGHTDRVTSLAFSPDGRWLASAAEDRAVLLWDLDRGEQVGVPMMRRTPAHVAFAATGPPLLHMAGDGWDVLSMQPQDWIDRACEVIGSRQLDDVERQRFLRGAEPQLACAPPGLSGHAD